MHAQAEAREPIATDPMEASRARSLPLITWSVTLPLEHGKVLNAKWDPGITYVVRIREKGTEHWSFGFETPVPGCTFADLNPDTEYEVQLRSRNASGDSPPTFLTIRTNPEGGATNVVPFPKR